MMDAQIMDEVKRNIANVESLINARSEMETNCTDPAKWRELGDEFTAVGWFVNADKCYRLAEHYEQPETSRS